MMAALPIIRTKKAPRRYLMGNAAIICSFSGGLDDMRRKDQGDVVKVLRALKAAGRFSVFEATANLTIARMMSRLAHKGCTIVKPDGTRRVYGRLVEMDNSCGYPWTKVKLTEAGEQLLQDEQERFT